MYPDYGHSGTSLLWKFRLSCIQLFAASSRFGTPDELKALIDAAHEMGIAVIMDIVHSHAVKNEVEGLGNFAGDPNQYFYPGVRREHPAGFSMLRLWQERSDSLPVV